MPVAPKPLPFIALAWHYQVSFHVCVNTYYYAGDVVGTSVADAEAAATAFEAATSASLLAALAVDVQLFGVKCTYATTDNTFEGFHESLAFGTVPGDALPAQDVAELIMLVHRVPGKRLVRGKSYMSGTPEGGAKAGLIQAPQRAAWDAFATDVLNFTGVGADDVALQMWSPRDGDFHTVASIAVVPEIHTLRRRRPST